MTERAILSIALDDIAEGEHIGLLLDAEIACLKVRLAAEGQLMPILVRRNGGRAAQPWTLVAGRHRVEAARALGWAAIDALQVADAHDGPEALLRVQVTENLDRRVLRPIERAIFIKARWDMIRAGAVEMISTDIDDAVGNACGCTGRTVRTFKNIHYAIVEGLPKLFAAFNALPAGESLTTVNRIAKLHLIEDRRAAVEKLLAEQDAPAEPADDAKKETPDEKWLRRSIAGFGRVTLAGQREHLRTWLETACTKGLRVSAACISIDLADARHREEIARHALAALTPGARAKLLHSIEGTSR